MAVKLGDKVSQGLGNPQAGKRGSGNTAPQAETAKPNRQAAPSSRRRCSRTARNFDCDMLVLGSGPGGYSAAFRAADLGMKTILVERYPVLGGVCLNVGCIPSKALLHTAAVMDAASELAEHGIAFGEPKVDLDKLRAFKGKVVGKLTGGLARWRRCAR
jgi:dihydrolipoamide dehydrogenase